MALTNEPTIDPGNEAKRQAVAGPDENSSFRFIPRELAGKCRKLVESYHAINGYGRLPDMLWNSDARDIIECQRELAHIFKTASKSRCAKRANESFVFIATVIASLEVLARDFAGWGKRFPAARQEAQELLGELSQRPRIWFMDKYLYPSLSIQREIANALAPGAIEQSAIEN